MLHPETGFAQPGPEVSEPQTVTDLPQPEQGGRRENDEKIQALNELLSNFGVPSNRRPIERILVATGVLGTEFSMAREASQDYLGNPGETEAKRGLSVISGALAYERQVQNLGLQPNEMPKELAATYQTAQANFSEARTLRARIHQEHPGLSQQVVAEALKRLLGGDSPSLAYSADAERGRILEQTKLNRTKDLMALRGTTEGEIASRESERKHLLQQAVFAGTVNDLHFADRELTYWLAQHLEYTSSPAVEQAVDFIKSELNQREQEERIAAQTLAEAA